MPAVDLLRNQHFTCRAYVLIIACAAQRDLADSLRFVFNCRYQ